MEIKWLSVHEKCIYVEDASLRVESHLKNHFFARPEKETKQNSEKRALNQFFNFSELCHTCDVRLIAISSGSSSRQEILMRWQIDSERCVCSSTDSQAFISFCFTRTNFTISSFHPRLDTLASRNLNSHNCSSFTHKVASRLMLIALENGGKFINFPKLLLWLFPSDVCVLLGWSFC